MLDVHGMIGALRLSAGVRSYNDDLLNLPRSARRLIRPAAGASAVQLYTGLIYHGPVLAARIKADLVALLRRDGFAHVAAAVGVDA